MRKIIRNAIQCKHCGDIIESVIGYDYVTCNFWACSVDGNYDYLHGNYSLFMELWMNLRKRFLYFPLQKNFLYDIIF